MKYILLVSAGILLVLVGLVAFLNLRHCPHVLRRIPSALTHSKYTPGADVKFRWVLQGYNSSGPRGSTYDVLAVKSSDCVTVGRDWYVFPTSGDAEAQFQEWQHSAIKILDATTDRAVLQVGGDFGNYFNIISKSENSESIVSIHSNSLEHAVLFEKRQNEESSGPQSSMIERPLSRRAYREPSTWSFCS